MQKVERKQRAKVGVSGSLINQLMSNNDRLPEVGKGCTQMHYTDRTCFEVVEVSKDYKVVKLEYLHPKADPTKSNQVGDQNWILEPIGRFITVQWRHNAWRKRIEYVDFIEKYLKDGNFHTTELYKSCFDEDGNLKLIEGVTELKVAFDKMNLIFGVKDYYYDWSF